MDKPVSMRIIAHMRTDFPEKFGIPRQSGLPQEKREGLLALLAQDPRPAYRQDERGYGMRYAGFEIRFSVRGNRLSVTDLFPSRTQTP